MAVKITGIKKAVGEFNRWQGAARIYLDRSTGEVWTKIYTDPGWWDEYGDTAIIQVAGKATWSMWQRDDKITMEELRSLCARKMVA